MYLRQAQRQPVASVSPADTVCFYACSHVQNKEDAQIMYTTQRYVRLLQQLRPLFWNYAPNVFCFYALFGFALTLTTQKPPNVAIPSAWLKEKNGLGCSHSTPGQTGVVPRMSHGYSVGISWSSMSSRCSVREPPSEMNFFFGTNDQYPRQGAEAFARLRRRQDVEMGSESLQFAEMMGNEHLQGRLFRSFWDVDRVLTHKKAESSVSRITGMSLL